MDKITKIFLWYLELFSSDGMSRVWAMYALIGSLLGLVLGSIIAIFTSWIAIPIAMTVGPIILIVVAICGFFGWVYGKLEGV